MPKKTKKTFKPPVTAYLRIVCTDCKIALVLKTPTGQAFVACDLCKSLNVTYSTWK
jgi:hypothetical protein